MVKANVAPDRMRSQEWFQKLPWHDNEKLAKLAEERHFEPGEVLFHQGDLADRFYVVVSGTVGMTLPVRANSLIAQVAIACEEIGWDALIEEGVRRFTATAMTPVQAVVFNGPELLRECERDARFGFLLMKQLLHVVSERLPSWHYRIHSMEYKNPSALPSGAVLVVGTGQSGAQIAEEL